MTHTESPSLLLISDIGTHKTISILSTIVKDIFNMGIISLIENYQKEKKILSNESLLKIISKNHNLRLLHEDVNISFLSLITQSINEILSSIDTCHIHSLQSYFIDSSKSMFFFLPISNHHKDNILTVDIGHEFCKLYGVSNPVITIPSDMIHYINSSKYISIEVLNGSTFNIKFVIEEPAFVKYNEIVKFVIDTVEQDHPEGTLETIRKSKYVKCLSIDLGSENFANIIDTSLFKPFVLEIPYIFVRYRTYIDYLDDIESIQDIDERVVQTYEKEKQLKRSVKLIVNKAAKYIFEYCKEHSIDTIICGKAGFDYEADPSYKISKFNFSAILQGLLRLTLKTEADQHDITYVEVSEDKTSQFCCKCGCLDKKGRNKKKNIFFCKECGTTMNGDINSTINLLLRYMLEIYDEPDRQKQIDYIYKGIDFTSLLHIEKIRLVKKT